MARARTLKPGFFLNDELAQVEPLGRLLFAGLWCIADRAGRLADRPLRIKAECLPYDAVDVDALLTVLESRGFITRYSVDQVRYLQVVNFEKHQTPHMRETDSTIPAPPSLHLYGGPSTVLAPDKHRAEHLPSPSDPDPDPDPDPDRDALPCYAPDAVVSAFRSLPGWPRETKPGHDRAKVARWQTTYPGVDLLVEVSRMESWLLSKPKRIANYRFVENWLGRAEPERNGAHHDHVQAPEPQPAGDTDRIPTRAELAAESARRHPLVSTVLSDL